MKVKALLAVACLIGAAAPAVATGGYSCATAGAAPLRLAIVTAHGVAPVVAQVRLTERGRTLSSAAPGARLLIAQSWIDSRELKLDLTDTGLQRYEARLRARITGRLTAVGTITRNGVTRPIRCTIEQ
ncbi:hypothetical protein [Sphingomonas sp.]|uniref:hypothetical protein n=1 Tax=Sphingomonas sp. TaxID=28214 RepID=UPI002FCABAD9